MIQTDKIPESILDKLRQMPRAQFERIMTPPEMHGSARELYRDACAMKRAGIPPADQETVLRARFFNYYRPMEDREFENAIANADDTQESVTPRWPKANRGEIERITAGCAGALERLRQASPLKNPGDLTTGSIIDRLFGAGDLLCFGSANLQATTEPRAYFLEDEETYPLIVPNPMSARTGETKNGRPSVRSLSNVGPRIHAVIEFDWGSLDEQAAVILHLSTFGIPLLLVVFSGSKSLHAWFDVRDLPAEEVEKFLRYAAYLGADTATFNPVQFVRMPNAWRDDERKQTAQYLS